MQNVSPLCRVVCSLRRVGQRAFRASVDFDHHHHLLLRHHIRRGARDSSPLRRQLLLGGLDALLLRSAADHGVD